MLLILCLEISNTVLSLKGVSLSAIRKYEFNYILQRPGIFLPPGSLHVLVNV